MTGDRAQLDRRKLLGLGLVLATGQSPALAARRKSVIFMTDWKAQAEHGGFYQALATGLYARAGLDVTIRAGGPQSDNARLLAAGAIDLGMISNSFQALTLAARGADVKVIMAAFQKDPQILMAHAGTGIATIADMKGRPIYVADAAIASYWRWLKSRYGFEDKQIRKYGYSLAPWLRDPMAIQEGYLSSEPFLAAQARAKPQVFLIADDNFPGYAAMVGATGRFLKTFPDVARRFVTASRQGWQDYMTADPAPANRLIQRDNPEMSAALLGYARAQMAQHGIVLSGDAATAGAGVMTDARWKAFRDTGVATGIYPKSLRAISAYSLDYLGA